MLLTSLVLAAGFASTPAMVVYDEPTASQWSCIVGCASRQPMLTQKMSKEFLLIAARCDTESNRMSLSDSIQEFDTSLTSLRFGCAEKNIPACSDDRGRKFLDEAVSAWSGLKPVFQSVADGQSPSADDIESISEGNVGLLIACEKAAKAFQGRAIPNASGAAPEAFLASRAATLTQQMAKEYVLIFLGQDAKSQQSSLRDNATRFETFIKALREGDADLCISGTAGGPGSRELGDVASQWSQFQSFISKVQESRPTVSDVKQVSRLSDTLLTSACKAVAGLGGSSSNSATAQFPDDQ